MQSICDNNPFSITRGSTVIVKRAVLLTQLHCYPTFPKNSSVANQELLSITVAGP